jgi:predicted amidohydrolase
VDRKIGDDADISVFKLEAREWNAVDSQKGTIPAYQVLTPVYAIRGNSLYEPLPVDRP